MTNDCIRIGLDNDAASLKPYPEISHPFHENHHSETFLESYSLTSTTNPEFSQVKVKQKGRQPHTQSRLRRKLNLEEGSLLEAKEHRDGILLKSLPPVRAGEVVGERTYREIIEELNEFRRKKGSIKLTRIKPPVKTRHKKDVPKSKSQIQRDWF